ncbi:ABC transporter ATP-binding protein [Methylobacterium oryzisoli]|uniref:ABC transporter ATP-binding protein n=1 Tax=Methylobacterium oryzisoli TaxID=3385502 RepID=UPI00389212F0
MAIDALVCEGLNAFYGESHVLHDVSLHARAGRVLALLGRNGAGKSTAIGAIAGLVSSHGRRVELFGESLAALGPEAISRRGLGLVPQGRRIFPSLTVLENLTVAARPVRGEAAGWTLARVYSAFPRLQERQRQFAGSLSGGEQQMLAIGRALMTNPRLILLDEPTEGLAPQIVAEVADVLKQIRDSGLAVILVEQNLKLVMEIADDVVIFNNGRTAHAGDLASIQNDPDLLNQHLGVF